MTLAQALQDVVAFDFFVLIYALVARLRYGFGAGEISRRLGLTLGAGRFYGHALAIALPFSLLAISISSWTSGFKGSMIAPFVGAAPTREIVASALIYGFLATGFPEELLFRGLIGGALFRRMAFWKANLLQAAIFMMPHLLILLIAPSLWPLAIVLPLALGLANGWLRQKSGSIGPGVLLHAIPNIAGALAVLNWKK